MYYISYTTTAKMIQELNLRVRNYPILGSYMAKKNSHPAEWNNRTYF